MLFGALPRRVSFLIKAEAVTGPIGWLLRNVGQYAINRDVPERNPLLRRAVPAEGRRGDRRLPRRHPRRRERPEISSGAGWLAARAGAAVLPVAVRGPHGRMARGRRFRPMSGCSFGDPFAIPLGAGRTAVDAATDLIRDRLSSLVIELDRRSAAIPPRQPKAMTT